MKKLTLTVITLTFLIISGCNKPEPKFYEKDGKTYFVDKEGDIYIIQGTSKIRIEEYVEPVIPKFIDYKSYENKVDINGLNLLYNVNIKYLDDEVLYRVVISDIDDKNFEETPKYKYIIDHSNLGFLTFWTGDGFEMYKEVLSTDDMVRLSRFYNDSFSGLEISGKFYLSKEKFSLIERLTIPVNFPTNF